jgi:hypothetical protein
MYSYHEGGYSNRHHCLQVEEHKLPSLLPAHQHHDHEREHKNADVTSEDCTDLKTDELLARGDFKAPLVV